MLGGLLMYIRNLPNIMELWIKWRNWTIYFNEQTQSCPFPETGYNTTKHY